METVSGTKVHGLLHNRESWLGRQEGALWLKDTTPFSVLFLNKNIRVGAWTGFALLLSGCIGKIITSFDLNV
jgi:hypothetical protein